MKIASTVSLSSADIAELLPAPVLYLVGFAALDDAAAAAVLADADFDVLVTDKIPPGGVLRAWSQARKREVIVLVRQPLGRSGCFTSRSDGAIHVFFGKDRTPIARAFEAAERLYSRDLTARATAALVAAAGRKPAAAETVLVVGAGIVGLMTALHLADLGYQVEVAEASADPRGAPDWLSLGCTHGGANARMFSLTECDNYHDRDAAPGELLHGYLRKRVSEFGWLIGRPDGYSAEDEAWIEDSLAMPVWLAERYNDDIFALNHESLVYWRELIAERPGLFEGVEFCEPLLRVASTGPYHAKQVKRQKRVGSYLNELDPAAVAAAYPSLADGVRNCEIEGGIEVTGFTVNVHGFAHRLINHLEARGVRFRWQARAGRIVTENGKVAGIGIDGGVLRRNHYFVSPGVYGGELLKGTASEGKVHGVLGAWMSIPNLEPRLGHALKIAREGHVACSGNIIPARSPEGQDILIFGSGFGYLGHDPGNIDPAELEALYRSMEDYLAAMFPEAFRQALADGSLRRSRKYCIRPWTASSLGMFEIQPAEAGLLVVATGHNTGGFSQSTAIARATTDAFQGRPHPMHIVYHPRRFEAFWLGRDRVERDEAVSPATFAMPMAQAVA